jgi:hypothetical protein
MKVIFRLFLEDVRGNAVPPESNSTALIGSPGVGTSILFFLAALYQAQQRRVVYYRITNAEDEKASLFFMRPDADGRSVRVWFSRSLDKEAVEGNGGVNRVSLALESELDIQREDYYAYIDGPHHADEQNLMVGTYDYFCTSSGFPPYKSEEGGKRLWILDGWTREEAVAGLAAVARCDEAKAGEVYWLCGGTIRDMLAACDDPQKVRREIDRRIHNLGGAPMATPLHSERGSADPWSPDRLRTMFLDRSMLKPTTRFEDAGDGDVSWEDVLDAYEPEEKARRRGPAVAKMDVMYAYQIVDSGYALTQLAARK